ncbi:MAG: methyltransferase [Gemmatimonadaceae bacterium]
MSGPRQPAAWSADVDALTASLERRFRTTRTTVTAGGHTIELIHPASPEDLIDEADFDRDERLPYWADVWPSAIVLARRIAGVAGAGRALLELGCGAGLVASAAALAGFDVTATDYYEDSLLFTRANVVRNGGREPAVRLVDWRRFPPDLGTFDMVVASDVLYEHTYGTLVAAAIARSLRPMGLAILADPGRVAAADFVDAARSRGLEVWTADRVRHTHGTATQTIDLYEVWWPPHRRR